ncbi:hypothetical protein MTO96_029955 [Rhipicephalus appendiculatus]
MLDDAEDKALSVVIASLPFFSLEDKVDTATTEPNDTAGVAVDTVLDPNKKGAEDCDVAIAVAVPDDGNGMPSVDVSLVSVMIVPGDGSPISEVLKLGVGITFDAEDLATAELNDTAGVAVDTVLDPSKNSAEDNSVAITVAALDEGNGKSSVDVPLVCVEGLTEDASPISGVLKLDVGNGNSEATDGMETAAADPKGTRGVPADNLLDSNKIAEDCDIAIEAAALDDGNGKSTVNVSLVSVVGPTEDASPIGALKLDGGNGSPETTDAVETATAASEGTGGVAVGTLLDPNKWGAEGNDVAISVAALDADNSKSSVYVPLVSLVDLTEDASPT